MQQLSDICSSSGISIPENIVTPDADHDAYALSGQTSLILTDLALAFSMLTQYDLAKRADPLHTSAILCVPDIPGAAYLTLLRGMHKLTTKPLYDVFAQQSDKNYVPYAIYYDASRACNGIIRSSELPELVARLHVTREAEAHNTFVFSGSVSGLPSTFLYDTGAYKSYINKQYAHQHRIAIIPDQHTVHLADGHTVQSPGYCKVNVSIGKYHETILLNVVELAPGFDVILGDEWSIKRGVLADSGWHDTKPSLLIRSKNVRLYPHELTPKPRQYDNKSGTSDNIVSAKQALNMLVHGAKVGSRAAFLVNIRMTKTDSGTDADSRDIRLEHLKQEFSDVFSEPTLNVYETTTPECIRVAPDATPPNTPPFRLSLSERREVESQVKDLLSKGFIEPSGSSYGAPVLFVPKPDGSWRMCIDYRALNKITTRNKYPLPRIDDLMDNLSGATCFSSLDLTSGYYQIALHPGDCEKTAFNTHIGKYEYKVLPMGLTNAPSVFQSVMNRIFQPMLNKGVCVYLDDILVYSRNEGEHFERLRQVFTILREHNLKLKARKCDFFRHELKFLGHIISANGIKPDPAKVAVVQEWPVPCSVFEVRSFLGLANYFRKYIQGYSSIALPLTNILKGLDKQEKKGKASRWRKLSADEANRIRTNFQAKWTPACEQAFNQIKQALISAPVLALPDFEKPFELVADACQTPPAIGAVLLQEGRPCAYISRKLNDTEANYSVSDIEMLAVIHALKEWRCYLYGARFNIVTDHKPNTYLDEPKSIHVSKRRARWLDISSSYDYTWVYRPGRVNVADPISRAPQHFFHLCSLTSRMHGLSGDMGESCTLGNSCQSGQSHSVSHGALRTGSKPQPPSDPNHWTLCILTRASAAQCGGLAPGQSSVVARSEQIRTPRKEAYSADAAYTTPDPDVGANSNIGSPSTTSHEVINDATTASPYPAGMEDERAVGKYIIKNFVERLIRGYQKDDWVASPEISFLRLRKDNEGLYWTQDNKLVVPDYDGLRDECLEAVHDHPYSGHKGVRKTLQLAERSFFWPRIRADAQSYCRNCDSCQRIKAVRQRPAGLLKPLDISGRRWESVSLDLITDLPKSAGGKDAIVVFVDRLSKMVHVAATTKQVTAAQLAVIYENAVFKHHGIPQNIVSDRDPRFTSQFWQELNRLLGTDIRMSSARHAQSDGQTENVNGVLEDTIRHYVGPFQTDWEERLPSAEFAINNSWHESIRNTPFMLNYGQNPDTPTIAFLRGRNPGVNQFVGKWSEQLQRAKQCLQNAQQRQKLYADKKRRPMTYHVGDQVLLSVKHFNIRKEVAKKLAPRYVGPFKVIRQINEVAYKLSLPSHVRMHDVFHVSALRPYHARGSYQPPPLPELIDGELEWEVDWVESTRGEGKRRQYLVHWVGHDYPTWEPECNLTNCAEKVREYWHFKGEPCPHPIRGGGHVKSRAVEKCPFDIRYKRYKHLVIYMTLYGIKLKRYVG